MSFGQFFSILRARWIVAALVLAVIVILTVTVSFLLPKQYLATASVVADFKPDPVSAMMFQGAASPAFLATQVDIINSDRVAQRVVRNLKLTENPQVREQWREATNGEGSIEVWLANSFQKNMDVRPSRESNVISVSYKAPDPRFASALANAFVQAYIDTSLELRVDPARQYSNFFDTRVKESREALERAQTKLSDFQKLKGIIASDERLDVENSRLNELSTQLVALQALQAESSSRQNQAQGGAGDKLQEVLNNPIVSNLKVELTRSEARLQELNSKLGENHPQVIEIKANIAETRRRMDAEVNRVTGGVTVNNTINKQRTAEIRASLEAQREKLLQLKAVRDDGAVLVRDVESAQRAYEGIVARYNQTTLESQTTQSNVNLLTPAVPPLDPSSPRILLNTLLSVFLGTLLAAITVVALELRDRRVRSIADIDSGLGLPILGVLPATVDARISRRHRKSALLATEQRLIGRLNGPKGA